MEKPHDEAGITNMTEAGGPDQVTNRNPLQEQTGALV